MSWTCSLCTFDGNGGNASCRMCGTLAPSVPVPTRVSPPRAPEPAPAPQPALGPQADSASATRPAPQLAAVLARASSQRASEAKETPHTVGASCARAVAPPLPATCAAAAPPAEQVAARGLPLPEGPQCAAPAAATGRAQKRARCSSDTQKPPAESARAAPRAVATPKPRAPVPRLPTGGRAKATASSSAAVVIAVDASALTSGATPDALHGAARALPNGGYALARECLAEGVTHLVRDDTPSLTLLTVTALARGVHIVTPSWVFESLAAAAWLPEASFACAALGPGPALSVAKRRAGWAGALGGTSVCFFGETLLPHATLAALVRAAGGRVEKSHRLADVLLSDAPQPAAGSQRARPVVPAKWLFDQIVEKAQQPLAEAAGDAQGDTAAQPHASYADARLDATPLAPADHPSACKTHRAGQRSGAAQLAGPRAALNRRLGSHAASGGAREGGSGVAHSPLPCGRGLQSDCVSDEY